MVLPPSHREPGRARGSHGRGRVSGLRRGPRLMRYLPLTDRDRETMLKAIGVGSVEDLFRDVPEAARLKKPLDLPPHKGEMEVERILGRMAARNVPAGSVP